MSSSPKKSAFVALVVIGAFAWGTLSARREIFPFPQLRSCWRAVAGDPTAPQRPDYPDGLWRPVRSSGAEQPEGLEDLANLPYLRGKSSQPDATGLEPASREC